MLVSRIHRSRGDRRHRARARRDTWCGAGDVLDLHISCDRVAAEGLGDVHRTDKTTIDFRGTATTPLTDLTTDGSGKLTLEGMLTVAHPDRTTTPASSITLDSGTYKITLTPAVGGGFNVQATLQGPTH